MLLAELTSPEIAALPRDIVVLVPVASCEQHSLHLPLFTDSLIAEDIVRRVHERIPEDVLVLPVQWLGYSKNHIRYPGTVSAGSETHRRIIMDAVVSLADHGFKKFLLVNSHGGNVANLSVLRQLLMERYGDEGLECFTTDAWAEDDKLDAIRELGTAGSGHSGETETAMILAIRPDLVRTDLLDADGERPGMRVPGTSVYYRFDVRTRHGGSGDPRPATAEKGERLLALCGEELAAKAKQIRALRPFG